MNEVPASSDPAHDDIDDYLQIVPDGDDVATIHALVAAERAVSTDTATPAQAEGVRAAGRTRRSDDRIDAWRASQLPPEAPAD